MSQTPQATDKRGEFAVFPGQKPVAFPGDSDLDHIPYPFRLKALLEVKARLKAIGSLSYDAACEGFLEDACARIDPHAGKGEKDRRIKPAGGIQRLPYGILGFTPAAKDEIGRAVDIFLLAGLSGFKRIECRKTLAIRFEHCVRQTVHAQLDVGEPAAFERAQVFAVYALR